MSPPAAKPSWLPIPTAIPRPEPDCQDQALPAPRTPSSSVPREPERPQRSHSPRPVLPRHQKSFLPPCSPELPPTHLQRKATALRSACFPTWRRRPEGLLLLQPPALCAQAAI